MSGLAKLEAERAAGIVDNPFESLLKVDKLYKGTLVSATAFFFVLLLFFFTLDESLRIHMLGMMVLDIGLIAAVVYYYPALKQSIDASQAASLEQQA